MVDDEKVTGSRAPCEQLGAAEDGFRGWHRDHAVERVGLAQGLAFDDVANERFVYRVTCRLDVDPVDARQDVGDHVDVESVRPQDLGYFLSYRLEIA